MFLLCRFTLPVGDLDVSMVVVSQYSHVNPYDQHSLNVGHVSRLHVPLLQIEWHRPRPSVTPAQTLQLR